MSSVAGRLLCYFRNHASELSGQADDLEGQLAAEIAAAGSFVNAALSEKIDKGTGVFSATRAVPQD